MSPPAGTLVEALDRAAALDRPGAGLRFIDRHEAARLLSWPELADRARQAAAGLAARGVAAGDRVALIFPTGPDFFDVYFGAMVLGAVPVPLYPPVRLGRLDVYFERTAAMLAAVGAVAVVTDATVRRVLGRLLDPVAGGAPPPLGLLLVDALRGPDRHAGAGAGPEALCMVQFSSGTTVAPKAVGLSHRAVLANSRAITGELFGRFPEADHGPHAGVSWLPLYHDMGLIGCVMPALDTPATLSLLPPEAFLAKPAVWLRALSRYGGTISPAPDFAYALCVERVRDEELEGVDLSRWLAALNGAEPIRPETLRRFGQRFAAQGLRATALSPVYGLSEAALAVTFQDLDAPWTSGRFSRAALADGRVERLDGPADPAEGTAAVELVRLGPPLPGFELQIRAVDQPEQLAGSDVVGRIFIRGPSLMSGYVGRAAQPFDAEGWLDTGDLGFLDGGSLVICGRGKDTIVLRGQNHHPHDLERAVDGVPGVRTGCAVAVGDIGEDGERVLLFVEVRTPEPGQAEACREAVRAATGVDPDLVVLLAPGTLPRTSSGKLRRSEALRQHHAGALLPPESVHPLMLAGVMARSAWSLLRAKLR